MLLKIIVLRYAQGKLGLPDDPVVILLELNRLGDALRGNPNPLEIIEQELVLALRRNDFPNASEFVKQRLANQSNQKGTIMLLLDGLDEVSSSDRPQVGKHLTDFLDTYEACRAVITCRTQVYRGEFSGIVQQTLNIEELSDQKIRQFLQPWEKEMPPDKSVDELLLQLRDRPEIKKLAQNPLLLTIIAFLYTDTPFVLTHSRAEFYDKSTNVLLETLDQARQRPNQYKAFTKRLLLQHLALYAQDSAKQRGADFRSLDYLKDVLPQTKKVLPSLNLDAEKDAEPILDEIVDRSGLLVKIDGGAQYQFTQLTLQEFFAAEQLLEDPQGLIDRFVANPCAWREVLKMWCGRGNDSTEVIRQVYTIRPLTAFEILADAQRIDPSLAKNIIENFKTRLGDPNQPPGMEAAFGLVASDTRRGSRGREVFQYLVDTLNSAQTSSMQKLAAMDALSRTNLIKAADELSKHYQDSAEIRQIMVRMGDLVVPLLRENARAGRLFALDDLIQIGTPDAVEALNQLTRHYEPEISEKATRLIKILLSQLEEEAKKSPTDESRTPSISAKFHNHKGFFVKKESSLLLAIHNSNPFPLEKVIINIDDAAKYKVIGRKEILISKIEAKSEEIIEFQLYPHREGEAQLFIKVNNEPQDLVIRIVNENPYFYGIPIDRQPIFFGRESEMETVLNNIGSETGANTMLLGEQRSGKTSLLYQVQRRLSGNYIPVIVSFAECASSETTDVLNWLLRAITEKILERQKQETWSFTVTWNPIEYPDAFRAEIQKIIQALQAVKTDARLVLMLDEAHEMLSIDVKFQNILRQAFIELYPELKVVMACYYSFLEEMRQRGSPLHNIFEYIFLKPLEGEALNKLIMEPAAEFGYEYEQKALESVKKNSGGHPYYCQYLCAKSFRNASLSKKENRISSRNKVIITVSDVEKAKSEILASDKLRFKAGYWGQLSEEEITVLRYLTSGKETRSLSKYAIHSLEQKFIISRNSQEFTSILFKEWTTEILQEMN